MDNLLVIAALIWCGSGIGCHIWQANQMQTWCGTPVWREPFTYMMFIPAMIGGPILGFFLERYPDRKSMRWPVCGA